MSGSQQNFRFSLRNPHRCVTLIVEAPMPDFCSCGAQLPEDARFCHKCGKPQREEIVVEQPPSPLPAAAPALDAAAWPGAPSFHHPVAVRVGLFVASIATFLCLALPFGFVI